MPWDRLVSGNQRLDFETRLSRWGSKLKSLAPCAQGMTDIPFRNQRPAWRAALAKSAVACLYWTNIA
jgi:hypothetical protein